MMQQTLFTQRFRELFIENETQQEFADRVGISRGTVANYFNGSRTDISSDALKKLCIACNVSANWLLGLSEVKNPSADLQAVCEYTGLSEDAINTITDFKKNDLSKIFNIILSNETKSSWTHLIIHFIGILTSYLQINSCPYPIQYSDEAKVVLGGTAASDYFRYLCTIELEDILNTSISKAVNEINSEEE